MTQEALKGTVAAVGAMLSYLIGGVDAALKALLLFMALDYVTGVFAAWYEKRLDSVKGFKGFVKKLLMLVAVVVAAELDRITGTSGIMRAGAIYYLLANEGLSILENLALAGILLPPGLKDALQRLRAKGEEPHEEPPA